MKMKLSDIANILDSTLVGADLEIQSIGIDTRALDAGDLYIAIKGHNFDGNEFVDKAKDAGAVAAILNEGYSTTLPYITVKDTRVALGQLASAWRDMAKAKLVGITGSNGKTTVKEMTAAILSTAGETLYTKGNLNNDIGVPLTLLRLGDNHRYAVIEMGANHQREIAYVSAIAKADVVILNNAGGAHIEGFGGYDGIAKGKGEIVETLNPQGIAILNRDDKYFDYWQGLAGNKRMITFGLDPRADVRVENIQATVADGRFSTTFDLLAPEGCIKIALKLAGIHNVKNALAATAAALALGLKLENAKAGLESLAPVTGRLQPLVGRLGNIVIDDTYNANADSLKAGVEVLVNCPGEHWVVLGAFGELGAESAKIHQEIGEFLRTKGVVRLLAIGSDAENTVKDFGQGATFFTDQDALINVLKSELTGKETIIIKGSRLQRMENVVAALVENFRT